MGVRMLYIAIIKGRFVTSIGLRKVKIINKQGPETQNIFL